MAVNKVIYAGETLVDLTGDTVAAPQLLHGVTAHGADGEVVVGAMPNNGTFNETIDGLTATSCTVPAGYTDGGSVSLTNDIETALAAL